MLDTASAKQIVAAVDRLRAAGSAVVAFEHREGAFAQLDGVKRERLSGAERDLGPLPDLKTRVPAFRVVLDDVGVELGQRAVLRHLDLALAGGQVWAIVGANGAGKTTLLRTLAGLQRHSGRTVGYATGGHPLPRLGLCFQNPDRQIFNPTVRQEILFGCDEPDLAFYDDVVELLGLTAYQDTPPLLLSEGEKKRLGLAILLLRPGLSGICLDEPTLGQDEHHRRLLGEIVRRLAGAGYLCVVATHDLEWATRWCDQLLLLQEGQIAAAADPASARRQPEIWTRGGLLLPESCTPCQRQSLSL
jgi:energy-coupling factor transporter ATP-binding protein EcfA2